MPNVNQAYKEYLKLQLETLQSFESTNPKYIEGQCRAINHLFNEAGVKKLDVILDVCCGDGVGLKKLREDGYTHVIGVELNPRKVQEAKKTEYLVYEQDFHDLSIFSDNLFDVVYSSHSIEHAYDANKVVEELVRVLKPGGKLIVVLPYPDHQTNGGHNARTQLGSDIEDNGKTLILFFENFALNLLYKKFDYFREPEIWMIYGKV